MYSPGRATFSCTCPEAHIYIPSLPISYVLRSFLILYFCLSLLILTVLLFPVSFVENLYEIQFITYVQHAPPISSPVYLTMWRIHMIRKWIIHLTQLSPYTIPFLSISLSETRSMWSSPMWYFKIGIKNWNLIIYNLWKMSRYIVCHSSCMQLSAGWRASGGDRLLLLLLMVWC